MQVYGCERLVRRGQFWASDGWETRLIGVPAGLNEREADYLIGELEHHSHDGRPVFGPPKPPLTTTELIHRLAAQERELMEAMKASWRSTLT